MRLRFITYSTIFVIAVFLACKKNIVIPAVAATPVEADEVVAAPVFEITKLIGSNMVVQRDKPFSIWGSAPAGDTVHVKASWNKQSFSAISNKNNNWRIFIPAAQVNTTPQNLTINDNGSKAVTFDNILIGEVWVCSGQSNMDMPVDSVGPWFGYEGVVNYQQEIANAKFPGLRLIDVNDKFSNEKTNRIDSKNGWTVCNPSTVKSYSAVAYFFGRKVMTELKIPVGLVTSTVGGTSCEAWTSESTLTSDPLLNSYYSGKNKSSQLYNGMINPLKYMSIKGFIWYQGENNRHDTPFLNYTKLNGAMIDNWRTAFNQGNLPFYFVQMTPYDENFFYGSKPEDNDYAFFREAQTLVRQHVSNTAMAVTLDAGDLHRIHPKDKKPVGERLGLLALHDTYGVKIQSVGPQYSSFAQTNTTVTINYKAGTANGLTTKNGAALGQYFFVAGTDKKFRNAKAVINGDKVVLNMPGGTPLPVKAIRYAFTDYPMTTLQNADGLPAEPFRTDNWNVVIQTKH